MEFFKGLYSWPSAISHLCKRLMNCLEFTTPCFYADGTQIFATNIDADVLSSMIFIIIPI